MAAPADYWDTHDLKQLAAGGLVNEDVMQKIWDISAVPLPFTEAIGTDTAKNSYSEWTTDELAAPKLDNAVVSGADASGNDARGGKRVGNHAQNSVKVVAVTERARSTDNIGRADEFSYQLMRRQQELRRDVEAIALSNQASQADDNNSTPGKTGGFSAWLETNTKVGANGDDGGFNTSTKVVDAPTPGEARALVFEDLRDVIEGIYVEGGEPTMIMSVPAVIKRINSFLLSSAGAPYRAQPTANVSGTAPSDQAAQGFINVIVTDFGFTLKLVPNRLQQVYDSGDMDDQTPDPVDVADVFVIDPSKVALAYLKGYSTAPLAKLGLSDRSQISVDWLVKVYTENAHGVIRDVDPTKAVVATSGA